MLKFSKYSVLISLLIITLVSSSANAAEKRYRGVMLGPDVTEQDISDLAAWRPNIVRYQLTWGAANDGDEASYFVWLEESLLKLDNLLDNFAANNMKVVIDLHTPPGGFSSQSTPALMRIFAEAWTQNALIATWEKIAERYKANDTIWGFDIVNEPAQRNVAAGLLDWNGLALEAVKKIRSIDTKHKIIIEPIYGDHTKIGRIKVVKGFPGIVYSPHMYYKRSFIQQGLYGFKTGVSYPKGKFNKKAIEKSLAVVKRFQKKNKVEIYFGEFTCVRWAPKKSPYNFLKDTINILEKNKWNWTYHAFREANVWSVEHGQDINNNDPVPGVTDRAALLIRSLAKNK